MKSLIIFVLICVIGLFATGEALAGGPGSNCDLEVDIPDVMIIGQAYLFKFNVITDKRAFISWGYSTYSTLPILNPGGGLLDNNSTIYVTAIKSADVEVYVYAGIVESDGSYYYCDSITHNIQVGTRVYLPNIAR